MGREGFYPSGMRNSSDSISNPSSALIKAILLNGAQYMKGVDNNYPSITEVYPYDNTQNYGRISLIDTLYIKNKTNIGLKIWDNETIQNDQTKMYTIQITLTPKCKNTIFTTTLVYNDIPSIIPGCNTKCLINDIDLFVIKNRDESITYHPNGLTNKDDINNVERIKIYNSQDGDLYTIYIKGDNIINENQKFALVATGCFDGIHTINSLNENVYINDNSIDKLEQNYNLIMILSICASIILAFICFIIALK